MRQGLRVSQRTQDGCGLGQERLSLVATPQRTQVLHGQQQGFRFLALGLGLYASCTCMHPAVNVSGMMAGT